MAENETPVTEKAPEETVPGETPSGDNAPAENTSGETADGGDTAETGDAGDTAAEVSEADKIAEELQKLKKELAEEKERYLRLDAEYYNYRNRSVKEKSEAYENASIEAVKAILPVVDDFERALAVECSDQNFKKGVEMIYTRFNGILGNLEVSEIEAEGQPFDPNIHNAVSSTEDENLGENVVAAVHQKGYMMGKSKKIIRPAMVTVANP